LNALAESLTVKVCTKCGGDPQPITEFYWREDRHGYVSICNTCTRQATEIRQEKLRAREVLSTEGKKICSRCKTPKPLVDFYVSRTAVLGRHSQCKQCHAKWGDTPEQRAMHNAQQKIYYAEHRDTILPLEAERAKNVFGISKLRSFSNTAEAVSVAGKSDFGSLN